MHLRGYNCCFLLFFRIVVIRHPSIHPTLSNNYQGHGYLNNRDNSCEAVYASFDHDVPASVADSRKYFESKIIIYSIHSVVIIIVFYVKGHQTISRSQSDYRGHGLLMNPDNTRKALHDTGSISYQGREAINSLDKSQQACHDTALVVDASKFL